jgi:dephospho-CoA kinase
MNKRILIIGGPRTGKTTLAEKLHEETGAPIRHMDDLIATHDWSGVSEAASRWFNDPGPWIIEGASGARALRKWLAANPAGKPCDILYLLTEPRVDLIKGQAAMAKGCETVWNEIAEDIFARGVELKTEIS